MQPATSAGGENYGWNVLEGTHCFNPPNGCVDAGFKMPALEYSHFVNGQDVNCSITGGFVYRGCRMPDLRGTYFYADFCGGFIRTFKGVAAGAAQNPADRTADLDPGGGLSIDHVSSFGEDARGEVYIVDYDGEVFKIVPR